MSEVRDVGALPTVTLAEPPQGRKLVATIGIDRYRHWRPLHNAVGDAMGAAALFRSLGFEDVAPPLLDDGATAEAINALVTDELTALSPDDSLVVFYAGHGGTRKQDSGARSITTGYLIPVDGAADRVAAWIEVDSWLRRIAKLPPRHILVILDACYSGIALAPIIRWGRDGGQLPALPFATLNSRPSRMVITSALNDEIALDSGPVPGHSLFTGCLIEALTGGVKGIAQGGGRRVTTGTDLGAYVRKRVQSYPGAPGCQQTPDFGVFDYDERGEMLIPLREDDVPTVLAAASGPLAVAPPADPVMTIALPAAPPPTVLAAASGPLAAAPPADPVMTIALPAAPPPRTPGELDAARMGSPAPRLTRAGRGRRGGGFAAVGAGVVAAIGLAVCASRGSPSPVAQSPVHALVTTAAPRPASDPAAAIEPPGGRAAARPGEPGGGAVLDAGAAHASAQDSGASPVNAGVPGVRGATTDGRAPGPRVERGAAPKPPEPGAVFGDQAAPAGACGAFVDSRPKGAEIVRDGQVIGHTPTLVELPCGTEVVVTLRKDGFKGGPRTIKGLSNPQDQPYFRLNRIR